MRSELRGVLAGCGFFGQIHLEAWRRMDGVRIVAACDLDEARARESAERGYARLEEMLDAERPDFLDIATRPEMHLPMVRAAGECGVPVICQKPLAPSWEECREIVRTAAAAGIRLMVHENWRWQPWYRFVGAELQRGSIGDPVTYAFRTRKFDGAGDGAYAQQPYFRSYPRLLIYETLIHHLDTARFLFGDVERVYAQTRRINAAIAGEDAALIMTTHRSGLAGVVDGHRFLDLAPDSPPLGEFVVEGQGYALDVTPEGHVELWDGRQRERVWQNAVTAGYRGDSVLATCQHFVDCLRSGEEFETNGADYLHSIAAMEAAYRSAASGRGEDLAYFGL